jgi:hypothetical protein
MTTQNYLHFQFTNASYPIRGGNSRELADALIIALRDSRSDVGSVNRIAAYLDIADDITQRVSKMVIAKTLTLPPGPNITELKEKPDELVGFVVSPEARRKNSPLLKAFVINTTEDTYKAWFT